VLLLALASLRALRGADGAPVGEGKPAAPARPQAMAPVAAQVPDVRRLLQAAVEAVD